MYAPLFLILSTISRKSFYCFQLCRENQFSFCYATGTARRIGTRKDGTTLITGAIPSNMKLLPYHRKPCFLPSFLTQINITKAVAIKNSANITGFPHISIPKEKNK